MGAAAPPALFQRRQRAAKCGMYAHGCFPLATLLLLLKQGLRGLTSIGWHVPQDLFEPGAEALFLAPSPSLLVFETAAGAPLVGVVRHPDKYLSGVQTLSNR